LRSCSILNSAFIGFWGLSCSYFIQFPTN